MDKSVNIAKGVAIASMVVGHVLPPPCIITVFIYKWHMPLFFFFSGYFFAVGKYQFKDFAVRRLRRLYVPFAVWSLLFLALHNVFVAHGVCEGGAYDFRRYLRMVYRIFVEMKQYEPLGSTFWFFPQLLAVNIIGYGYLKVVDKEVNGLRLWQKCILAAFPLLLATVMSVYGVAFYVGQISYVTMLGLFFFVSGYFLRGFKYMVGWWPLMATIAVVALSGWGRNEMIDLHGKGIIAYSLVAIAGILLIYNVSVMLSTVERVGDFFDYLGSHSLSIMILHFAAFKIVSGFLVAFGVAPFALLKSHPVIVGTSWSVLVCYIVVGIGVPLALNEMYVRTKNRLLNNG